MAEQTPIARLFERYLDNQTLTDDELSQLKADPSFAELVNEAQQWQALSSQYRETDVPNWDMASTFDESAIQARNMPVRKFNWALAASFAVSFCMLALALSDAKLALTEQGFEVAFGGQSSLSKGELTALLKQHQADSDKAYLNLLQQVVNSNREERQKELSTVVKQINDQRQQDRALLRLQLDQLAEQIEQEPAQEYANVIAN
jgi:hypothetical protein